MKYYSEILKKNFDTVEDLETAERNEKERVVKAEKERMAAEAERKEKAAVAKAEFDEALQDYKSVVKKYNDTIAEMKRLLINAETRYLEKKKKYEETTCAGLTGNWDSESIYRLFDMFKRCLGIDK